MSVFFTFLVVVLIPPLYKTLQENPYDVVHNFDTRTFHYYVHQWVVIEMGHNDGGSLSDDDGRSDCPGSGAQVCYSEYDGVNETIYTFPAYLEMAADLYLAQGARVILSSATPNNPWETGSFVYAPNRFEYYTWLAAQVQGGPAAGVYFVSHGDYTAQLEENLGATVVDANFPNDHTVSSFDS